MRWGRLLGIMVACFLSYVVSFAVYFLYSVGLHQTIYSFTLEYLLSNPQILSTLLVRELIRNPFSLIIIALGSFAVDLLLNRH